MCYAKVHIKNKIIRLNLCFFPKKNILIPNVAEKKSDSEFLSYNLMLISGGKNCALCVKKNKYSNSCCPEKKIWMKNKNYSPPPCMLNGRSLTRYKLMNYTQKTSSWSYYCPFGWTFSFRRWFIHWKLWFVLVYRQTKANMLTLLLHETILII
jgi:hypothetical protein